MVDIKITVKSVETTDEGTLVIEMSPYPYARWIQTEALADANVAVQPYGVIMVPEAATFTPGGLTVDVEVKGYIFSVPLATLMEADAEDQIDFISPYITVADLADVDLTDLQNGQILIWDSTNNVWVNGSAGASTLSALTDTTITTPTNGQVLTYDSTASKWKNADASGGEDDFIVKLISSIDPETEQTSTTADKTYAEIEAAYLAGKIVRVNAFMDMGSGSTFFWTYWLEGFATNTATFRTYPVWGLSPTGHTIVFWDLSLNSSNEWSMTQTVLQATELSS